MLWPSKCPTCQNYVYPICEGPNGGDGVEQEHITLGSGPENVIEEVETFMYLGDVVDRSAGAERTVRRRVAKVWSKCLEIAGLLCSRMIPMRSRSSIYEACIRLVMLYGSETWVDGRRPRGRPRKTWMDNVTEDMRFLKITDETALDSEKREMCHRPSNPARWEQLT